MSGRSRLISRSHVHIGGRNTRLHNIEGCFAVWSKLLSLEDQRSESLRNSAHHQNLISSFLVHYQHLHPPTFELFCKQTNKQADAGCHLLSAPWRRKQERLVRTSTAWPPWYRRKRCKLTNAPHGVQHHAGGVSDRSHHRNHRAPVG